MNDLKRQANLLDYETQARVIVQLADIRVVMLGVLRKPPYYAVNHHARALLHPEGVDKPSEPIAQPQSPTTRSSHRSAGFPTGGLASSSPSPSQPNPPPLTTSRTRSPSRERRRNSNLRLSRTLTHESTVSTRTTESSSNRSSGIMERIRRWTTGSSTRAPSPDDRTASPSTSPRLSTGTSLTALNSPATVPAPSAMAPLPSTPVTPPIETSTPQFNTLPRLRYPEPTDPFLNYPNFTPGGDDNRWRVEDGLEEGGLVWVGPVMITAQLVSPSIRHSSAAPLTTDEVYSEGHHVSFRWHDLVAIAPWMEERLSRRDDALSL